MPNSRNALSHALQTERHTCPRPRRWEIAQLKALPALCFVALRGNLASFRQARTRACFVRVGLGFGFVPSTASPAERKNAGQEARATGMGLGSFGVSDS